ncbi:hypothetical protein V1521DRAFT_438257 [Lipomyces starkeyi]
MNTILGAFCRPAIVVLGSDVCMDWWNHSYMAKFSTCLPSEVFEFQLPLIFLLVA